MKNLRLFATLVILGVAMQVAARMLLQDYGVFAVSSSDTGSLPVWYSLSRFPLAALAQVLPAFLVGWFAMRSGFVLGAFVGALSSFAYGAISEIQWQNGPFSWQLAVVAIFYAIGPAIISAVAGGAGEFARIRLPSNNSFKGKPLRGSP